MTECDHKVIGTGSVDEYITTQCTSIECSTLVSNGKSVEERASRIMLKIQIGRRNDTPVLQLVRFAL